VQDGVRQAMYTQRNVEARSRNCCRAKAESTPGTYSECVSVALIIQRCIIQPHVACQAAPYLSTLSN
jgi:hypothetical protein